VCTVGYKLRVSLWASGLVGGGGQGLSADCLGKYIPSTANVRYTARFSPTPLSLTHTHTHTLLGGVCGFQLHQLLPPLLTCVVTRQLGEEGNTEHFEVRYLAARILVGVWQR
jgi:hypothetical protein